MKIKIFGKLTDIFNGAEYTLNEGVSTVSELKHRLEDDIPELKGFNYLVVVDQQIISEEITISEGADIALLPPFSGG